MSTENYFQQLAAINVNDKTEKKNGLTYLSWAFAWGEIKALHPDATYTVYENADGMNYHTDGKTCWVKTGVTVNGIEHIEYLPIMNFKNQSISLENVTSYDVNKAIQRSITKACARHGLGLYIYAGEDIPESEEPEPAPKPAARKAPAQQKSYSPQPVMTAVVDPSVEITQQMVDEIVGSYTSGKSKDEKLAAAKEIKAILGTTDFKNVADPALRAKLYYRFKELSA